MVATEERTKLIGQRMKRKEDPRFITGKGRYTEDIALPGMLHAAVLRPPFAHARIVSIDTSAAAAMPGVVGVFVGDDIELPPLPYAWQASGVDNNVNTPRVLAQGEVKWLGDGVAVAVAETVQQAYDAIEAIEVEYEELPAVVDAEKAYADGAPQLHENAPNNLAFDWSCGDAAATDAGLAEAEVVVSGRLRNQRLIATPMETRISVCDYNSGTEEFTFYITSQAPHVHRLVMAAFVLGVPEQNIRVVAPDIGGGFGSKIFVYPDQIMVGWLSRKVGRPVRWVERRADAHVAMAQGRDHISDFQIGAKRDGTITGLKVRTYSNMGAYLSTAAGGVQTTLYARMTPGVYQVPNTYVQVLGVYTNTPMVDAYRGAGRPEAAFLIERAIDSLAAELGMDPVDVRRKNFVPSDAFPWDNGVGMLPYDSGDYHKALEKALDVFDYESFRAEQARRRENGERKQLGVGFSTYVEACGLAPSAWMASQGWGAALWESANVKVHLTGKVVVTTGSMPQGQGHETTFSQIVADRLGVPFEDVQVKFGDTLNSPFGYGTYGSRSLAVGGEAIVRSTNKIVEKASALAAHLLEVGVEDIEFSDGVARVKGAPEQHKTIQEIAGAADLAYSLPEGMEPYLDETSYFDPSNATFPFGAHIAVVEVDTETGQVALQRYVAIDDFGNLINPLVVDGQVHGGIVQGIGQALWEGAVYDDNGQILTGTLMEYAIPHADHFPMIETGHTITPSPVNEMGVKGAGEAGTIGSTPCIVNAVVDALAPLGITNIDMPLSAPRVWAAIQEAQGGA